MDGLFCDLPQLLTDPTDHNEYDPRLVFECSLFSFKLVSFFPEKLKLFNDLCTRFALKDPHIINLQCLEKSLGRFNLLFDLDTCKLKGRVRFTVVSFVDKYESYSLYDSVGE